MPLSKCSLSVAVILLLRYRCVTPTVLKVFGGVAYATAGVALRVLWRAGLIDKKGGVWCLRNATKADVIRAVYMSCYKMEYMRGIDHLCSLVYSTVGNGTIKLSIDKMLLPPGCAQLMGAVYRLVGRHVSVGELREICEQLKVVPSGEKELHLYIDVVSTLKFFNRPKPSEATAAPTNSNVSLDGSNNDVEEFETLPGRF